MTTSGLWGIASADIRILGRDPLLKWIVLLPVGLALLLRVLIPRAEALLGTTGFQLEPYYPLVMGGYLMTAPGIVGMVIGFLLLDERDAQTLKALRVTPLSIRRYLTYRITLPLLVGTGTTLVGYPMIGISPLPFTSLLAIAIVAGLAAPLIALILAAVAPNKVAGFAVVKVLNGINLIPIAAFFVPPPIQYLAGIFPTYWPMRALWSAVAREEYLTYLVVGAVTGALAVILTTAMFERRLLRHG